MERPSPEEIKELCYTLRRKAYHARKNAVNGFFAELNAGPIDRAADLLEGYINASTAN